MKPIPILALAALSTLAVPTRLLAQVKGPTPARYTITDIGTLGGANSFAYSINNSGVVAGGSNTAGQDDFVMQTAFLWDGGEPISLGTLGAPLARTAAVKARQRPPTALLPCSRRRQVWILTARTSASSTSIGRTGSIISAWQPCGARAC